MLDSAPSPENPERRERTPCLCGRVIRGRPPNGSRPLSVARQKTRALGEDHGRDARIGGRSFGRACGVAMRRVQDESGAGRHALSVHPSQATRIRRTSPRRGEAGHAGWSIETRIGGHAANHSATVSGLRSIEPPTLDRTIRPSFGTGDRANAWPAEHCHRSTTELLHPFPAIAVDERTRLCDPSGRAIGRVPLQRRYRKPSLGDRGNRLQRKPR